MIRITLAFIEHLLYARCYSKPFPWVHGSSEFSRETVNKMESISILFSTVFLMPRTVSAMQKVLHVYLSKGYS